MAGDHGVRYVYGLRRIIASHPTTLKLYQLSLDSLYVGFVLLDERFADSWVHIRHFDLAGRTVKSRSLQQFQTETLPVPTPT